MDILSNPEIWVGLGFLIVIGIILYQRVPAFVAAALDQRASAIAKELSEAERLRDEARALFDEFVKKAAQAEKEAESILRDAKDEAERFAVEARAQLKVQIERRAKQAQDKIAQAEAHAIAEIRALAADAAADAAKTIITARTDANKAAGLIAKSLTELQAKL